jgi:hypothetical protein
MASLPRHVLDSQQLSMIASQHPFQYFFHVGTDDPLQTGEVLDRYCLVHPTIPSVNDTLKCLGVDGVTKFGDKFLSAEFQQSGWSWPNACREIACEFIRTKIRPDEPSRLSCVFGFATLADAHTFKAKTNRPGLPVWKVGCNNAFKKDMTLLDNRKNMAESLDSLIRYWKGEQSDAPFYEYLLAPQVIVFDRIE